jgi:hypothetical protein
MFNPMDVFAQKLVDVCKSVDALSSDHDLVVTIQSSLEQMQLDFKSIQQDVSALNDNVKSLNANIELSKRTIENVVLAKASAHMKRIKDELHDDLAKFKAATIEGLKSSTTGIHLTISTDDETPK